VKQGLDQRPASADKQTLLQTIRQIGLLQLDTIHVVARSHYLVMLSRVGPYDASDLDALLHPDRCLFEQWAHAACLIPVEDYEYFLPMILARREDPLHNWTSERLGDEPQKVLDEVLARVCEEGPLASRDFSDPRGQRGTWWDWKPAKTALEILFSRGYLLVDRRVNFQRYYDLAERVLPASAELPSRTVDEYQQWTVLRGVSCLGAATAAQISDYYRLHKSATRAALKDLALQGVVVPVEVTGWKERAYLHHDDLPLLAEIEAGDHQPEVTVLLSPFDNLIWDRQRVQDLFGFEYRAEMYVPAAKRQYGYFVVPILHQGRLVGRLDPKAERQSSTLIVRAIYLEPGQPISEELLAGIAGALREFMAFHACTELRIEQSEPESMGGLLLDRMH
jgi:uncharacterized protein YcaQ